ncbi:hypothetical protein DWB84_11070 [Saccharophagus sp. K07]|nr:hypothetical protein [Saccharophagus sp. K07]
MLRFWHLVYKQLIVNKEIFYAAGDPLQLHCKSTKLELSINGANQGTKNVLCTHNGAQSSFLRN